MKRMKRNVAVVMALLLSMFALSACGSSDNESESGAAAGTEVVFKAVNYKFAEQEYRLKKGETYTFKLDNKEGNHGMEIKALGINLNRGHKSKTVTLNETGEYEIVCSVPCGPGHMDMTAKLIVE